MEILEKSQREMLFCNGIRDEKFLWRAHQTLNKIKEGINKLEDRSLQNHLNQNTKGGEGQGGHNRQNVQELWDMIKYHKHATGAGEQGRNNFWKKDGLRFSKNKVIKPQI